MKRRLTEELAAKTWCPWSRVVVTEEIADGQFAAVSANRIIDKDGRLLRGTTCLGSRCHGWDWDEALKHRPSCPRSPKNSRQRTPGDCDCYAAERRLGYCALKESER